MNSHNAEIVLDSQPCVSAICFPLVHHISLVRCHSASQLPWHNHPLFEVLMLIEGAATYEFRSGNRADLVGGQFMILPPHTMHRGLNNLRRPSKLCGMMLAPQMSNAFQHTPFDPEDLDWIQQQYQRSANMPFKMSNRLKKLVMDLAAAVAQFEMESRPTVLNLRIKICQVIYEIARDVSCPQSLEETVKVNSMIQFMREHLHHSMSIDDVAQAAGCSRSKLYEVFKESTGMTPNDYWQRIRIEIAYERLMQSNESITQIAMDCGFNTSQYFCTVFRKYWGISPRECRNLVSASD